MGYPAFTIAARDLSHRFERKWLFRSVDIDLRNGQSVALTGPNGSGKSTLLRILTGQLSPSAGEIGWTHAGKAIPNDRVYSQVAWQAPYLDLFPAFTLREAFRFYYRFKHCQLANFAAWAEAIHLREVADRPLQTFSSGMLQRVKVGLAVLSTAPFLVLDEPTSFMDEENAALILSLIRANQNERVVVIASNLSQEVAHIDQRVDLRDYLPT